MNTDICLTCMTPPPIPTKLIQPTRGTPPPAPTLTKKAQPTIGAYPTAQTLTELVQHTTGTQLPLNPFSVSATARQGQDRIYNLSWPLLHIFLDK